MPLIEPLNVPQELVDAWTDIDQKEPELFRIQYLAVVRPDPRDVDVKHIIRVSVCVWARDVEEALRMLRQHPQTVMVGNSEEPIPPLFVVSVGAISGVTFNAMLVKTNDGEETPKLEPDKPSGLIVTGKFNTKEN